MTQGAFDVKAGSLFPGLHRLEHDGWITGSWETSKDGRRVKSYELTKAGRRQLGREEAAWERLVAAMNRVPRSTPP